MTNVFFCLAPQIQLLIFFFFPTAYIIWLYWMSPFSYGLRALCMNELTSPRWNFPTSATDDTYLGHTVLLQFDFFTDRKWIW